MLTVVLHHAVGAGEGTTPVAAQSYGRWVQQLGASRYDERAQAAARLTSAGPDARPAIVAGLDAEDLEIRSQCQRLLREIDSSVLGRTLTELEYRYSPEREYRLPGWELYRTYCGEQQPHRSLFVRITRRNPAALQQLVALAETHGRGTDAMPPKFFTSVPTAQLRSGDPELWTLLLLAECSTPQQRFPMVSNRILEALQDSRVAASFRNSAFREPLDDLLGSWIERKRSSYLMRYLLKVCLVHHRRETAEELASDLLQRDAEQTTAADRQAALLTLAQVAPQRCAKYLEGALSDSAASHTWRTSAHARTIVQTEVRDAALAALLRLNGYDPREYGFVHLRPDPVMGFRDFSIGFVTHGARQQAHLRGRRVLALDPISITDTPLDLSTSASHVTAPQIATGGAAR